LDHAESNSRQQQWYQLSCWILKLGHAESANQPIHPRRDSPASNSSTNLVTGLWSWVTQSQQTSWYTPEGTLPPATVAPTQLLDFNVDFAQLGHQTMGVNGYWTHNSQSSMVASNNCITNFVTGFCNWWWWIIFLLFRKKNT